MKRRDFLAAGALATATPLSAALLGCSRKAAPVPAGSMQMLGMPLGHQLRDGHFAALPPPSEVRRLPLLVVGAGIGGLSAGWALQRAGFADFTIHELETTGGNARYGENGVSRYPLGAHYLPLPPREAIYVRELLADLGALQGHPRAARPSYDEARLCHTPQERLYRDGVWQDGLIPRLGLNRIERDEIRRFLDQMAELKEVRDAQGRRAFALPVALSSPDAKWRRLDRLSMADWLHEQGYRSAPLHWYVNYACRDDFGTEMQQTSAWAAIHYFACRNGEAANAAADAVLTAPEGNGWIVRALSERLRAQIATENAVYRLSLAGKTPIVDVWLAREQRSVRYAPEQLIWAAPLFVLARLAADAPAAFRAAAGAGSYAPWLVANLTLAEPPPSGAGAPLAWDNVLYEGEGLGYIVATHQNLRVHQAGTVLTYYRALSAQPPQLARAGLLTTSREVWAERILGELGRAHGERLRTLTSRLDVCLHGHAMIRPTPGSVWGEHRQFLTAGLPRVHLAHADVSGLSLFEEANYRGVMAAQRALKQLGMQPAMRDV
jgi:phytoene dehydrogenase-like protein